MNQFQHVIAIARKDLRSEFRSKEAINAAFAFSLVILLIFSFAFEPTSEGTREVAGGLLWIVFTFAGTLILNRSFARDTPNDCLEALIGAPVAGWALFLGKAWASFALLLSVELVSLPVFAIFYDIPIKPALSALMVVMLLGTWAVTVVGTAFSALTVNVRLRELMLPTLIYPIIIPALIAAMTLTASLLNGESLFSVNNLLWLRMLAGFGVIYTALGLALIDIVLVG